MRLPALAAVSALLVLPLGAQSFRASDQVYLPAVGHLGGSLTYASDITISNLSADPVNVTVQFAAANTANPVPRRFQDAIKLKPGERREIVDFAASVLGVSGAGQAIFSGCKQGADCSAHFADGPDISPAQRVALNRKLELEAEANYRNISVESRIYSFAKADGPTVGQAFPATPWNLTATSDWKPAHLDEVFIAGIRSGSRYRTNIGLVNASEYCSTTLVVTLYDGADGGQRDQATIRLTPLENTQRSILDLFPLLAVWSRLNPTRLVTNAVVTIRQLDSTPTADAEKNGCPNGCPAFLAFASLLDNLSNDAVTLDGQFSVPLTDVAAMPSAAPPLSALRMADQ